MEKSASPRAPNAVEQRPAPAPASQTPCETCAYVGSSSQVASHAQATHQSGARYEIRQMQPDGSFVVEDCYNGRERCVGRARAREDQTGHLYQVWDREEEAVVFGG